MNGSSRTTWEKIRVALRRLFTSLTQDLAFFAPWPLRSYLHRARGVKIRGNAFIGSLVVLDDAFPEYIYIEDNVQISAGAKVVTHDSSFRNAFAGKVPTKVHRVIIRKNAYIGSGAIILPGVTIGESAIVGAGAVVASDVPPRSIAVGVPARVLGTVDERVKRFLSSGGLFLWKYYEKPRPLTESEIEETDSKL